MDRKTIFHLTKPIHFALPWKLCAALLLLGTSLLCGCSYSHGQAITSKEAGEKNALNEASKANVAPEAEKAVESEKKAELFDGVNHISMFDGETLGSWQVADMYHNGNVYVKDGCMILEKSDYMTGVKWTGPLIDMNYEISYEAMRVEGDDFFAALTFPVGKRSCTLERVAQHGQWAFQHRQQRRVFERNDIKFRPGEQPVVQSRFACDTRQNSGAAQWRMDRGC